jgi:hypothetical protein
LQLTNGYSTLIAWGEQPRIGFPESRNPISGYISPNKPPNVLVFAAAIIRRQRRTQRPQSFVLGARGGFMKYLLVVLSLGLLAGCAGKVYTTENPKPDSCGRINGVIVYQPKPMIFVIETTQAQDKNGNVVGSSDERTCKPVKSFEVVSVPDYTKPYAVGYDAALFSSHKFSLELDKGVITKVNNESTSAAKDTVDVVKGVLGTAKEFVKERDFVPACNAGKKIVGRMDISDIPIVKP